MSPLQDPQPPQVLPPRSAQVLLLMELADQRSLHTAISKGRLSGNLVRPFKKAVLGRHCNLVIIWTGTAQNLHTCRQCRTPESDSSVFYSAAG